MEKQNIKVTVNDGYNGAVSKMDVYLKGTKIYFSNATGCHWSGRHINKDYRGLNKITLPIRSLSNVIGFEVTPPMDQVKACVVCFEDVHINDNYCGNCGNKF